MSAHRSIVAVAQRGGYVCTSLYSSGSAEGWVCLHIALQQRQRRGPGIFATYRSIVALAQRAGYFCNISLYIQLLQRRGAGISGTSLYISGAKRAGISATSLYSCGSAEGRSQLRKKNISFCVPFPSETNYFKLNRRLHRSVAKNNNQSKTICTADSCSSNKHIMFINIYFDQVVIGRMDFFFHARFTFFLQHSTYLLSKYSSYTILLPKIYKNESCDHALTHDCCKVHIKNETPMISQEF